MYFFLDSITAWSLKLKRTYNAAPIIKHEINVTLIFVEFFLISIKIWIKLYERYLKIKFIYLINIIKLNKKKCLKTKQRKNMY